MNEWCNKQICTNNKKFHISNNNNNTSFRYHIIPRLLSLLNNNITTYDYGKILERQKC